MTVDIAHFFQVNLVHKQDNFENFDKKAIIFL